jgi:TPR repeat protein
MSSNARPPRKILPFWLLGVALVCGLTINSEALAERRAALVIGISSYKNATPNPGDDAKLIADTLRSVGFNLIGDRALLDLTKAEFDSAVQEFSRQAHSADVTFFYFAGYGVQVRGSNYLLPSNINLSGAADVPTQTVNINLVLRLMEDAGTKLNIVILDACRINPFRDRGLGTDSVGLAAMQAPKGTLISFATQPGAMAADSADGRSLFAKALSDVIKRPGLSISDAFNEVGLAVMEATNNHQQPWVSSTAARAKFYFVPPVVDVPSPASNSDVAAECDRLAARPADRQRTRPGHGVRFEDIDPAPAIAACEEAVRKYPDVAQYTFQEGRALLAQKNYTRARALYEQAAAKGYNAAMTGLGTIYLDGWGVPKDRATARQWYEKGVALGDPLAMTNLGALYAETQDYAMARQWYEKAAESGEPYAMVDLGKFFKNGRGIIQNYEQAYQWFDKAAALDDPQAMENLAALYEEGLGVQKDFGQARQWYEKAAALGSRAAMTKLGILYENGNGVAKNYAVARQWYEKAGELGELTAMTNLGAVYERGLGVEKNYAMAHHWYEKAAELGDPIAMDKLGDLYESGLGVAQDATKAQQWHERAQNRQAELNPSAPRAPNPTGDAPKQMKRKRRK